MYFHAKWRIDPDLFVGRGAIDLPYVVAIGKGVFVGCAAMIMNPTGVPTAGGNWWGEGDEKFMVDGEKAPSIFGTGSEDYFNYSWSRPDLFAESLLRPAARFRPRHAPVTSQTTDSRCSTPCLSRNRWRPSSSFGRTRPRRG